jgi:hypothetical protein
MIPDEVTEREFQMLYERVYGRTIDADKARELAHRLLSLYDMLLRRAPGMRPPPNLAPRHENEGAISGLRTNGS